MRNDPSARSDRPLRIYVVAGEASGDHLGAALVAALKRQSPDPLVFAGLGGPEMANEGIEPVFPLSDVAVMGAIAILKKLPLLVRKVHAVVDDCVAFNPDILVIIDSPEFTHPIAKRVRRRLPELPIVDYVSPSVWAWRSYRAKKMRAYVDRVLAILPFEPEAHRRLGGPECVFVGHPLSETVAEFRGDRDDRVSDPPCIVVLPGSRTSEITSLMDPFGEAVAAIAEARPDSQFVIPAADGQVARIRAALAKWTVTPEVVCGRSAKLAAFRSADAAIAASGTVTLELALARVPMVVCYRIDWLIASFRWLLQTHSVVLANLVAGGNDIPELIHKDCTPEHISATALPLLEDTPERRTQVAAFDRVEAAMRFDGPPPSERAAASVLEMLA